MMINLRRVLSSLFLFCLAAISIAGCASSQTPIPATATQEKVRVHEYKNTAAFDALYPEGWIHDVFREGILVFAPPDVHAGTPGPSITVMRISPLQIPMNIEDPTLQNVFDEFLIRGPQKDGFIVTSDVIHGKLGQYDSLSVSLEREESGKDAEYRNAQVGYVSLAITDSGAVYSFMATAPTEQWQEFWRSMSVMFTSVTFNE